MIAGGQRDDGVIAVGSPAGLHHIALRGPRGQARRRSAALHVDDDARYLGHDGKADGFLHERESRPARCRHCLCARQRRPDHGAEAADLVFHLDETAADSRKALGEALGDLRGWRDGIAGEEAKPSVECGLGADFVALKEAYIIRGLLFDGALIARSSPAVTPRCRGSSRCTAHLPA